MKFTILPALILAAALTACGGGGSADASNPANSTLSFPLAASKQTTAVGARSATYDVSGGDCSGTFVVSRSAGTPVVDGTARWVALGTVTVNVPQTPTCSAVASASRREIYYDGAFNYVGSITETGEVYEVVGNAAYSLPDTTVLGDSGVLPRVNHYSSRSRTTLKGWDLSSWVIEPDTATTVVLKEITNSYAASGALESTRIATYRIGADGSRTETGRVIQLPDGPQITATPRTP